MISRPNLPTKDIWVNCVFPFLDKDSLYVFSSLSKEARQLVFSALFQDKKFSSRVDRKLEWLTGVTECRYSQFAPPLNFELNVLIGVGFSAISLRSVELISVIAAASIVKSMLAGSGSASLGLNMLGLVGAAGVNRLASHGFQIENQKWLKRDKEEVIRQKELRLKRRRLVYLRDELPKLSVTNYSLFAKPYNSDKASIAKHGYMVDPGDTETLFFRCKCIAKDLQTIW